MEKVLKNLPDLINVRSIDDLSKIVKNPDSFTIRLMTLKSKDEFVNAFNVFNSNNTIKELVSGLNYNESFENIIKALKESDNDDVKHVAEFMENKLQNVENINLSGKTLPAIMWATVIYRYMTDNQNHIGITDIDDIFELLPVSILQCMSLADIDAPDDITVEELKQEVLSIFDKTELNEQVKGYIATAFIKNRVWGNRDNSWYDFDKLQPIKLSKKGAKIDSIESLLETLKTPTPENYQNAIDYVAEKYFNDSTNNFNIEPNDLKNYKAHLVVALLSSSLIEENSNHDFDNVALNLCAKIIANKEKIETAIGRSSIAIKMSKAYESTLLDITQDAEMVALDILRGKVVEDDSANNEIYTDDTLPATEKPEEKKSSIKIGDRKAYINGYLKLFGTLVNAKLSYYENQLKVLADIYKRKSYSEEKEATVNKLAEECDATAELNSIESVPINSTRLHLNAGIVADAMKRQHAFLSQINGVFAKVKRKAKDNLDIQNLEFDYKLLQKTFYVSTKEHENIIKQFYALLADDALLKSSQTQYRLAPTDLKIADLKDRAKANAGKYPTIADMLSLIKQSKGGFQAKRTVDKLYINSDGSVNEKYETLYKIILSKDSTIAEKRQALEDAVNAGLLTEEQEKVINEYLYELIKKQDKKKFNMSDDYEQLSLEDYLFGSDTEKE